MEKFNEESAQNFFQILDVLTENTTRIGAVAEATSSVMQQGNAENKESALIFGAEVYRLIVVYTHAMLEYTLREITRNSLKYNLNLELPTHFNFVGTNSPKISLKELRINYSGWGVDDIILRSIDSQLDSISFSSTTDIVNHLKAAGHQTPKKIRDTYFPTIQELCMRRHQIVHRADISKQAKGQKPESIEPTEVRKWVGMTISFLFEVFRFSLPIAYRPRLDPIIDKQIDRVWDSYRLKKSRG